MCFYVFFSVSYPPSLSIFFTVLKSVLDCEHLNPSVSAQFCNSCFQVVLYAFLKSKKDGSCMLFWKLFNFLHHLNNYHNNDTFLLSLPLATMTESSDTEESVDETPLPAIHRHTDSVCRQCSILASTIILCLPRPFVFCQYCSRCTSA